MGNKIARERLADAYESMTPADIAERGLRLADWLDGQRHLIESQASFNDALLRSLRKTEAALDSAHGRIVEALASLARGGRRDARAALESVVLTPPVRYSELVGTLPEIPALPESLFDPAGDL